MPVPGDRMADINPEAENGALFPVKYCVTDSALTAGTHGFDFIAAEKGQIRHLSANIDLSGGTATINVLKNGTTVMVATQSLSDDTPQVEEGLGTDTSGADEDFNTNTATNKAKLIYAKGDKLTIEVITASATGLDFAAALTCDEKQPKTKFDMS